VPLLDVELLSEPLDVLDEVSRRGLARSALVKEDDLA
jgi:hypothetical protein